MPLFGGADLHSHSTYSDGVETPAALVARALGAGLSVFALTDHDALAGLPDLEAACRGTGLVAVGGTELSVDCEGEDVHVLGLFVDPAEPSLAGRMAEMREARAKRGERMVERLAAIGISLDLAAIKETVGTGSFGRPHVARALVAGGHARDNEEAFDRYLSRGRPGHVPKLKWTLPEAIAAVRGAGGLSFVAHPAWYADPEKVVEQGARAGLDGLEVFHTDQIGREGEFGQLAARHGLLASAGSDFHGTGEGGRSVGLCRLDAEGWERLCAAAVERRAGSGRPPVNLAPR